MQFTLTNEIKKILKILNNTNESIFITGAAGTGKSSLLNYFVKHTNKKHVILAPTGIAALNVNGQTIHSFFRFPPTIIRSNNIQYYFEREKLFEQLEMVIIDEVSMVRSDIMNGIDIALRLNRKLPQEPFGGLQMVFIGDLFQLPPVLSKKHNEEILELYGGKYFFEAPVFEYFNYHFVELTKIFRQSPKETNFKTLLNKIRTNNIQTYELEQINLRYKNPATPKNNSIFLTSRKNIAQKINNKQLDQLEGNEFILEGTLSGKYEKIKSNAKNNLENKLPAPYKLRLKKNAQIMMVKNDVSKRWVNGNIGKVIGIDKDAIIVEINNKRHSVEKETWNEIDYEFNKETNLVEETILSSFTQYPLQLAYAITIHKSQGKTFDNIIIDIGNGAFAHGQVYVALSRCKSLNGIFLNNIITKKDIIVDPKISDFYKLKVEEI